MRRSGRVAVTWPNAAVVCCPVGVKRAVAFTADASRPTVTKAPPVSWAAITSPIFNWTGIYLGVNGGFSFGGSDWTDSVTGTSSGSSGTSGFIFGGTLGANYQAGSLVFGVEADGD